MREIVIPGEEIAGSAGHMPGDGTHIDGGRIVSRLFGIADISDKQVRVVPLNGRYLPVVGDYLIGIVEAIKFKGCFLNINSAYNAYLPTFSEDEHKIGDILLVKVDEVDEIYNVTAGDARMLYDGKLIEVVPVKIPRIVGKKASMIDMLRDSTGCRIFVGRNGRIFIKGGMNDVRRAEGAIRMIEEQAHTSGLTDRVKGLLGSRPQKSEPRKEEPKAPEIEEAPAEEEIVDTSDEMESE